jgi:glucokinase
MPEVRPIKATAVNLLPVHFMQIGSGAPMLGIIAGNLALMLGVRGGIYMSSGIVPRLGARFAQSEFRSRLEMTSRFHGYLEKIPTRVIIRPLSALVELVALLKEY